MNSSRKFLVLICNYILKCNDDLDNNSSHIYFNFVSILKEEKGMMMPQNNIKIYSKSFHSPLSKNRDIKHIKNQYILDRSLSVKCYVFQVVSLAFECIQYFPISYQATIHPQTKPTERNHWIHWSLVQKTLPDFFQSQSRLPIKTLHEEEWKKQLH